MQENEVKFEISQNHGFSATEVATTRTLFISPDYDFLGTFVTKRQISSDFVRFRDIFGHKYTS